MADNIFSRSALDIANEEARARSKAAMTEALTPQAAPITNIKDLAIKTQVPANLIEAVSEASGVTDLARLSEMADTMAGHVKNGAGIEDALQMTFPDADVNPILDRADAMARATIQGPNPAPDQPATPEAPEKADAGGKSWLTQGLTQIAGGAARGLGSAADEAGERLTQFASGGTKGPVVDTEMVMGEDGIPKVKITGTQDRGEIDQAGVFREAGDAMAGALKGWADRVGEANISEEARKEMQNSGLDGSVLDPKTIKIKEGTTARGLALAGLDAMGSLVPIILTGIATGGAGTIAMGASMSGGSARETAEQLIDEAANSQTEDGRTVLETESPLYRREREAGKSHEDAVATVKKEAGDLSSAFAAPIGALGGYATGKFVEKGVGALASQAMGTRVVGNAVLSALEEGTQEAAESIAARTGAKQASGLDIDVGEGTANDFLLGAMAGAPAGAIGGIRGAEASPAPDALPAPERLGLPAPDAPTEPEAAQPPMPEAAPVDPVAPVNAAPIEPAPAPERPPMGALSQAAAAMAPIPEAPARVLREGMPAGAQIDIAVPDMSQPIRAEFVEETPNGVTVKIDGQTQLIPRDEIDAGEVRIAPVDLVRETGAAQAVEADGQGTEALTIPAPDQDISTPEERTASILDAISAAERENGVTLSDQDRADVFNRLDRFGGDATTALFGNQEKGPLDAEPVAPANPEPIGASPVPQPVVKSEEEAPENAEQPAIEPAAEAAGAQEPVPAPAEPASTPEVEAEATKVSEQAPQIAPEAPKVSEAEAAPEGITLEDHPTSEKSMILKGLQKEDEARFEGMKYRAKWNEKLGGFLVSKKQAPKIVEALNAQAPAAAPEEVTTPPAQEQAVESAPEPEAPAVAVEEPAQPEAPTEIDRATWAPELKAGDAPMADYSPFGPVNGYDGGMRDDGADAPVKEAFKKDSTRFGRKVVALAKAKGFLPTSDLKGKAMKQVSYNAGGIAGSGDTYVSMQTPNGTEARLSINADGSMGRRGNGVFINFQIKRDGKFVGPNIYPGGDITPSQMVDLIETEVSRVESSLETASTQNTEAGPRLTTREEGRAAGEAWAKDGKPEAFSDDPAMGNASNEAKGGWTAGYRAAKQASEAPATEAKPEAPASTGILGSLSQEKQDRAAELKKRLAAKARTQTSSGLDPEYITLGGELVALYIEAGTRKFGAMLKDFAETTGLSMREAQEPMRAAYGHVRDNMDLNGEDISGMDDHAAVMAEVRRAIAEEANAGQETQTVAETPESADIVEQAPEQEDQANVADADGASDREPLEGSEPEGGQQPVAPQVDGPSDGASGSGDAGGQPTEGDRNGRNTGQERSPETVSRPSQPVENPGNYAIPADFDLGGGTPKAKLDANIAAIRIVKALEEEGRFATPEEQAALAKYVGWGGLRKAVDPKSQGKTDMWGRAYADLKELLTDAEYDEVRQSTRNAHYTARPVVDAMWKMMGHFGFNGGRALEPTVGSGNFLGLQPQEMAGQTEWYAAERDILTGKIAKHLYPDATVADGTSFENANFGAGVFDIAIGNPPFGSNRVNDPVRKHLDRMKVHNYIVNKTGEHLRPGGMMAMVITHRFLDTADSEGRGPLAENFRMVGAIRLPNDAFAANAGTEVTTDIVIFQKLREGEKADKNAAWLDTGGEINVDGQNIRVNRYFQENPHHILGRSAMDGTMYAGAKDKGEYTVHSDGRDLNAAIADIIEKDWAGLAGALGERSQTLNEVADVQTESNLAIGEMMLNEAGDITRRTFDNADGTPAYEIVNADTFWGSEAMDWSDLHGAAQAIMDGGNIDKAIAQFEDGKGVAFNAGMKKKANPKEEWIKAVYALSDAIEAKAPISQLQEHAPAILSAASRRRLGETKLRRLQGMLGLRETATRLVQAERIDAPNIEALREKLNRDYKAFQKANGYINDPANQSVMGDDIGLEVGLEADYTPKNGTAKSSAKPAAILQGRVNYPVREITNADDAQSGLVISMSERGKVDIGYIATLTGQDPQEVIADLTGGEHPSIFFDPETETYVDADRYLSGNVKAKLARAEEEGLEANAKALKAAIPAPLPKERIKPTIRSQWIPTNIFQDFMADLGIQSPLAVALRDAGMIALRGGDINETEFGQQFKDDDKSVLQMMESAVNGKPLTVMRSQGRDNPPVKDDAATKRVNALVKRMSDAFKDWAYADEDRAAEIVEAYNENMNTHVERGYDGAKYLKPVGASANITLRRTQKNGAWRMMQDRTSLMDHVVGAGKTMTAITGIMERRRLGLSRKPMIAVPNHLVTQWAREWYELYPGAKLLAATPKDFERKNRRRLLARIATGNYDAIIIGHSSLGFIQNDPETERAVIDEAMRELRTALDEARRQEVSKRTITQIENKIESYKVRLAALADRTTDDVGADFKSMGVDFLTIDEAHEFKNLEYSTIGDRLVGMNDPKGSKRAFDLFIKVRTLLGEGSDGAVSFLTGTPVSNSLVEVYSMMKYLAWDDLKSRHQHNFDAWSAAFVEAETKFEYNATQKLVERRVMSGLVNLDGLTQLYKQFADVIDKYDLARMYAEDNGGKKFPTPKVKDGGRRLLTAPATPKQTEYTDFLVARMEGIKEEASNKDYAKVDNPLWVLSDARKASLDIRTIDPSLARDPNSKVARSAREIKRIYDAWADDKGTQMVFSDLSTPSKSAQKEAKSLVVDAFKLTMPERTAKAHVKDALERGEGYQDLWSAAIEAAEIKMDADGTKDEERDAISEKMAAFEEASPAALMLTADVGFSVYDDLRAALVEMGIPEREVEFIHDHNTPEQKAKLFKRVNDGDVRVLIGSTPKMGAGTNAQKRLVALHHLDSPWRPSDVEQREGRIIRQGNSLYARDPEGFEVEILAYSTEGTSDIVLWQILERKSRAIEKFRRGELDEMEEGGSDADSYAEFMAASTGNPVFRQKMEADRTLLDAEAEISGTLLARVQAERFLRDGDKMIKRAEARRDGFSELAPGDLSYKGKTAAVADLDAAMKAAYEGYQEKLAKYEEKRAKVEAEQKAAFEAGIPEEKWPRLPVRPSKPTVHSQEVRDASSFAALIREVLEDFNKAKVGDTLSFQSGNVKISIEKGKFSNTSDTTYEVNVSVPGVRDSYYTQLAWGSSNDLTKSRDILAAFLPSGLEKWAKNGAEEGKTSVKLLTNRKKRSEKVMAQSVDTGKRDRARADAAYYKAAAAVAELEAEIERSKRPNQFAAENTVRTLGRSNSQMVMAPVAEHVFEGETYSTIGKPMAESGGYDTHYYTHVTEGRDKNDQPVMLEVKTPKDRNGDEEPFVSKVMEAPKGAKQSRLRKTRPETPRAMREELQSLTARMNAEIERLGLKGKITVKALKGIKAGPISLDGFYLDGVIGISATADEGPMETFAHEVIHALRDSRIWGADYGLFTKAEWQGLVRQVRKMPEIMDLVAEEYADLSPSEQLEEAIAEMYARWKSGTDVGTETASLLQRISDALGAIVAALRGEGFNTAAEVFARIEAGQIGRRGQDGGPDGTPPTGGGKMKGRRKGMSGPFPDALRRKAKDERGYMGSLMTSAMNGAGGFNILALVPGQALLSELSKAMPSATSYMRIKQKMDARRNQLHSDLDKTAQDWRALFARNWKTLWLKDDKGKTTVNQAMMDLMHETTIAQIDPSKPFQAKADPNDTKIINEKSPRSYAYKQAEKRLAEDIDRRIEYDAFKERFDALPADFQAMYRRVRDAYSEQADAFEKAVLNNAEKAMKLSIRRAERKHKARLQEIADEGLTGDEKAAAIEEANDALAKVKRLSGWTKAARLQQLRSSFESNRLGGPYFPLKRFGSFFVTARDENGKVISYSQFESEKEQQAEVKALKADGHDVTFGTLDDQRGIRDAVDPSFVADVEALLEGFDAADELKDLIWQRWLESLPDMSVRKSRIHRKGRAGYSSDAFRAFGHQMFHGAHQLARLEHAMDMTEALEIAREEAQASNDPNRNGLIVNELQRRHEFTMNPTGSGWATKATGAAFVWYLAATPAAAIINLSQTTVVGPAILGAYRGAGIGSATKHLGKALTDFTRGRGEAGRSKRLTSEERAAMEAAYQRGVVDKTQAHDLAGVSESGVEYSAVWQDVMGKISYFFHHAERMNREITYLAAYRMAREIGEGHEQAIETAGDLTWKTHFDYQNNSRPRVMQGDAAKVIFTFRNFQVNMLYRLFRDMHQTFAGADAEARKEARTQLIGISGSMMLHAGVQGVWGYSLIMGLLNMFFGGDDDDLEAEMEKALYNTLGKDAAAILLKGVPGYVTNTSLTDRMGMPDLWFRSSDRLLEGDEQYQYYLSQLLGPIFGIPESIVRGASAISEGHYWRGIEKMLPNKSLRDAMKATRYANEGATTYKGDPIIDEFTTGEVFKQALGFTPARLAEQYDLNTQAKNMQTRIADRKSRILKQAGDELMAGEPLSAGTLDDIKEFSTKYGIRLGPKEIRASIRGRIRASANNQGGIVLPKSYEPYIRDQLPPSFFSKE